MGNPLFDLVDDLGQSSGTIDAVRLDAERDRAAVVYEPGEMGEMDGFDTVRTRTAGEDRLDFLGTNELEDGRKAAVVEDTGFFDSTAPDPPSSRGKRVRPTDTHREPDGQFQRPPSALEPVPEKDAFRTPDGQFTSTDLEPADEIGRRESNGLFDLLR